MKARVVALAVVGLLAVFAGVLVGILTADGGDDDAESVIGTRSASHPDEAIQAPAFTSSDLTEAPTDRWITNGGSVYNQRYSPLDEIGPDNVGELRGVWMTRLRGSGVAAKYSAEGQPIYYAGVIYISTGADDVFAVDVATGRIKWQYQARLDPAIDTICCGWLSRGVALGDGKVFLGQLDGRLVALDQQTGRRIWSTRVGDWRRGYTITAAPLYYDGKVITGVSGGEFSIRGRIQAYDAATGKEAWRFYTVPGPGEVGHDSWPARGDAWKHGGAPVWQTPAVDPDLGLLYFSTGNASPDLDGSGRAGDNLFAASIVALDASTGAYQWHYQLVHHDIWDYDAPSPIVLFDAEIGGRMRQGLAEASKTGWVYLLDRRTGKPLLPIEERPVPQDRAQRTAATQPIPSYPPLIDHAVTAKDVADIRSLAEDNAQGATPRVLAGGIYAPFGKDIRVIVPGPQGGTNWQPMSYSPETRMLYVCGMRSVAGYSRSGERLPEGKQGRLADLGSVFTTTGFGSQAGHFTAVDVTTGRIVWQNRWPESCYSGSTSTGGGLVFVGRNAGQLEAYDATTGDRLWRFQTGAGANSTVSVFEFRGREMIAFLAGGNALAGSPHGDRLWLFSLDGTIGPASPPGAAGGGVGHAGDSDGGNDSATGNAAAGRVVFQENCGGCHGADAGGANGGPDLTASAVAKQRDKVVAQVTNGGGSMPAFAGSLTEEQIVDVAAYVVKVTTDR